MKVWFTLPWQHGLKMVRTRPFHGGDAPSRPLGVPLKFEYHHINMVTP